ncbi:DHA2 family efflux MFS transporter permease subunit [Anatilimnocola floriformis]|uniref:DHA2 family efflux MFS transporter permease subunit n=1 Tax=Anatilimnocola floriformis TaxID=2948575 RepID=UPI0020C34C43|nr:DHA2 family efflux MFS transporter permease subunit [Anatilimnocola floriformis]
MSTIALAPVAVGRPAIQAWFVAAAVIIPTFMEVLDTTVAIVSLRYIAGDLSAAVVDAEWILTSYLAANATILPISGWLSARLGRRNYFLGSIAVFTIASALCGMATSLWQIILFRVIQGLAGGGLQPSSQAILIDSFPPEKQGTAMTMFGIAALTAPVVGPTLGGYLSDYHNWRWIFFINIPIGCFAFVLSYFTVKDPEYLQEERAQLNRLPLNFDYVGLALLALVMAAWEVLITKGQEWDWLADPFGKVQTLLLVILVGGAGLVVWEMRSKNPVVNFRPLGERNFWLCCLIIFFAYSVLYGVSTTLPGLLQTLFGYDAYHSGLVMSPSGLASVTMLLICGALLGRGVDARWMIGAGLLVVAIGGYWMSVMNLEISPWQAIWPRVVLIAGLGMAFAPINVAAFLYTPRHLRAAAVGLFALLRNEGGSFGTSMAQTVRVRRDQFHTWRVGEFLDPFNPAVNSYLERAQAFYFQQTGDAPLARQMALQSLADLRAQQASSLAFFDVFLVAAVLALLLAVLVLLMKRSVAEKGAHIGAE